MREFLIAVCGLAALSGSALAQVRPPAPVTTPAPAWPAEADVLEAVIDVALTIEADGHVSGVELLSGAGEPFDTLAVEAARTYVFEPATQDGEPVRVRVRFRIVMEAEGSDADPDADSDADPDADSDADADADAASASDSAPGSASASDTGPDPDAPEIVPFGAVAVADAPREDSLVRTIQADELGRLAGTRGDPIRSLELLPGVGRPPLLSGNLIIRGSAPRDSAVFFDGVEVPLLYHFGGLTSVIPGNLLDSIDFLPGGFSVRYGRRIGGVAEVSTRQLNDGLHGGASFAVLDTSAHVEGGSRIRGAVAARRSLVDVLFRSVVPTDLNGDVAAPAYWDYQAFLDASPTSHDDIRLRIYGAHDQLKIDLGDPRSDDPAIRGNLGGSQQFHFAHLRWLRRMGRVQQDIGVAFGPDRFDAGVGGLGIDLRQLRLQGRAEWRARLNRAVTLRGGLDLQATFFDVDFFGPPPREAGNQDQPPLASERLVRLNRKGRIMRPAVYVESRLTPHPVMTFAAGLRVDYFGEVDRFAFDPRGLLIFRLREHWELTGHVGLFSQAPELSESEPTLGNANLDPLRAMHTGLGVMGTPIEGLRVSLDLFAKSLWNLPVNTPNNLAPHFVSDGVGRIYGAETLIRFDRGPLLAQLSYTWSRSERRTAEGAWRRFDFDQPHVLAIAIMGRLPRGWSVGGTFRFASGNPTTPVVGSIYDASSDVHFAINGERNSARDASFRRLDLRVEKQWQIGDGTLRFFIDLQNATNVRNAEGVDYNYDFSQSRTVRGLPILPSVGIAGER